IARAQRDAQAPFTPEERPRTLRGTPRKAAAAKPPPSQALDITNKEESLWASIGVRPINTRAVQNWAFCAGATSTPGGRCLDRLGASGRLARLTRRYWVIIGEHEPMPCSRFGWGKGCHQRLGVVHVSFETQQRTPRASSGWYRDLIAAPRRSPRASPEE